MKTLRQLKSEYEAMIVRETLRKNRGNRENTARALGLSVRSLNTIIEKHRLVPRRKFARPLPIPGSDKSAKKTRGKSRNA